MKKIAITAAIVIILLLVLPFVLGMQTEGIVRGQLASMGDNPVFSFDVESFDRGWFSSSARVGIGLDSDYLETLLAMQEPGSDPIVAAFLSDTSLTVVVNIDHGPVVLRDGAYFGLAEFVARFDENSELVVEIQRRLAMPYLVEMRGRIGYTGAFTYEAQIPPIDYADETGELTFSGALVEGSFANGRLLTNGNIESVDFDTTSGSAAVRGIHITGDNEIVSHYLTIGTMQFAIEDITVVDAFGGAEPIFVAENLRIASDSGLDQSGKLMSATITYAADSITAGEQDFELTDAELALRVTNLDVAVLNEYYDTILGANTQDDRPIMAAALEMATRALERSPTLAIDPLQFRFLGEPFEARLEIRTNPLPAGVELTNPAILPSLIEASANATASKILADRIATEILKTQIASSMSGQAVPPGQDLDSMAQAQAQLMLATLLGQGLIVNDGGDYTTEIQFANGALTVNGNPMPLGLF